MLELVKVKPVIASSLLDIILLFIFYVLETTLAYFLSSRAVVVSFRVISYYVFVFSL